MPTAKKNKMAGKTMTGAEAIIQVIADESIDTIFGYSGGAILPSYDAIFRYNEVHAKKSQINLVVPANEQGAGFMAAGYSRATGKVGVFMVTSGPGATNTITPIRDSAADSVPLVMISGQVATPAIGTDAFQEAPVFNLMSTCAKHVFLVSNADELEDTVRTAFYIARCGRPGPVVIDVPKDVQNQKVTFRGEGMLKFHGFRKRMKKLDEARPSNTETAAFFKMLKESEKPLVYAGGGVINSGASQELRAFLKKFKIPVVTTLTGIGSVDANDDLSLGMLGMHGTAYANYAVQDCDFLISVAARFDDRVAGRVDEFARDAKIAHIDIDEAEIGKVKAADWSFVGDAKVALKALIAAGKGFKKDFSKWAAHTRRLKHDHALSYEKKGGHIQPQQVMEIISELTKGDAIICTGVGQHQMWAAQYFKAKDPRSFITSASMGTMGFGLPAAIGAQMACPDKLVVDIDGDGSLRMNIGELETATTYKAPIKIVLINNLGDGMVRQWQHMYFGKRFAGTDKALHKKDFVKAAQADGFKFAKRVSDKSQLRKSLKALLSAKGPAFLEVLIDRNAHVYPMVGPGAGYSEMVTGPYITPRKSQAPKSKLDMGSSF